MWLAVVLLLLGAGFFTLVEIAMHRAEPVLRARVIDGLSNRFKSRVELGEFHVSIFKALEVSGSGLRLYPYELDSDQPLFAIKQFRFRTTWQNLTRNPMEIGHVYVDGMEINLPPKQQRKSIPKLDSGKKSNVRIVVGEIVATDAMLRLGTSKPGKEPLEFAIKELKLQSVGANRPMHFDATLINPKPVGDIVSSGHFGPWNADDPHNTPVSGSYTFSHADLSTIKGIGGILSSTGNYQGTLDNIVVDGQTDTPDFRLSVSGHPVPLHTTFHAIVDGTTGDTNLQPVDATLLHSHFIARGAVVKVPQQHGHHIQMDVVVDKARIEDLLKLGVRTDPPIMTGSAQMKTKLDLPPGDIPVSDKLRLKGTFQISGAHFTNEKIQSKLDNLSMRSQGKPKEAKDNIPDNVPSSMKGVFTLDNSKLTFTQLGFNMPGTDIDMNGIYSMDGNQFDFHGTIRLDARLSQMVGGWKSIFLKPVDPFFAKHGAGTEVPFKITGTKSEPKFGLDFHHKDDQQTPNPDGKDKGNSGNRE